MVRSRFIAALDPATGKPALWRSDGTEAGTTVVNDVIPGEETTVVNGSLEFAGEDRMHGAELWTSDGTSSGTKMVKDINPGPHGSFPSGLILVPA